MQQEQKTREADEQQIDRLADTYLEAMRRIHHHEEQRQVSHATQGENFVLYALACHGETMTPGHLSSELGMTSARMAAVLGTLEKKGYVKRQMDVKDRRRIIVELTEKGRQQAEDNISQVKEGVKQMLRFLGETDAGEFVRILKRLADRGKKS